MCTGIRLIAENGAVIYARTLEFARAIQSNIIFIPRAIPCIGTTTRKDIPGLSWKTKYAAIGANAANEVGIIDGVNEVGLAGGLFYLPKYAHYQDVTETELAISLAPWELMTWILTTCATVAQVKQELQHIKVANVVFDPWGIIPPIHAVVHDQQGNSVVIEYVEGTLHLHDNPLGVITNSPTFDWHMTNLKNYIKLCTLNAPPRTIDGITLSPLGQGSGTLGMPGDFTPPSRFVRAVFLSHTVKQLKDETQTCAAAFHVLDLFNIPIGAIAAEKNGQLYYDYTQWTSALDLRNKRYYFHTYADRTVHMVDLMQLNLDDQEPKVVMRMDESHS